MSTTKENTKNPQVILASTSPFRKSLIEKMMIDFKAIPPLCDEDQLKIEFSKQKESSQKKLCSYLSEHKALSLRSDHPDALIIGSDQALFLGEMPYDKPHTIENATAQLQQLSGKTAELLTATTICYKTTLYTFENITKLYFKKLTENQIKNYLKEDNPLSCAGSFMFEKKGIFLFEKIECSDPSSIEGLPLMKLSLELSKLGVTLPFLQK